MKWMVKEIVGIAGGGGEALRHKGVRLLAYHQQVHHRI